MKKHDLVTGCWRTGKNPLKCAECGLYNICYKMYMRRSTNEKQRDKLRISR